MKNPHISVIPITPDPPGVSYPPSSAQEGQIWWDSGRSDMVVFLNGSWEVISSSVAVHLDYNAERAIDWAIIRMNDSDQETDLAAMAAKYPIVAEAIGQLEVALKLSSNLDDPK
jgi:hypothetical protein